MHTPTVNSPSCQQVGIFNLATSLRYLSIRSVAVVVSDTGDHTKQHVLKRPPHNRQLVISMSCYCPSCCLHLSAGRMCARISPTTGDVTLVLPTCSLTYHRRLAASHCMIYHAHQTHNVIRFAVCSFMSD